MIKEAIALLAMSILLLFTVLFLNKRNKFLPMWAFEVLFGILCVCIFIGGGFILLHVLMKLFA